jgi:hypothetical protein
MDSWNAHMSSFFSSPSHPSWWSIKTTIECALFINVKNVGCYFIMPRTFEAAHDGEVQTQIRPYESKQLSKAMACYIHKLSELSLHGKQTSTVSNKPLMSGVYFEFCPVWLLINLTALLASFPSSHRLPRGCFVMSVTAIAKLSVIKLDWILFALIEEQLLLLL